MIDQAIPAIALNGSLAMFMAQSPVRTRLLTCGAAALFALVLSAMIQPATPDMPAILCWVGAAGGALTVVMGFRPPSPLVYAAGAVAGSGAGWLAGAVGRPDILMWSAAALALGTLAAWLLLRWHPLAIRVLGGWVLAVALLSLALLLWRGGGPSVDHLD